MYHKGVSTTATSAANGAGKAEVAAVAGASHLIWGFSVIVSDAAGTTAGAVTLKDGTTVIYNDVIPAAAAVGTRIQRDFLCPLAGTPGNPVSLNSAALGAGCKTICNLVTELIP